MENPCVIQSGRKDIECILPPADSGQGIGTAESNDLIHWEGIRYLDFPEGAMGSGDHCAYGYWTARARQMADVLSWNTL